MNTLTSPRLRTTRLLHWIGKCYLTLFGWKVEGDVPPDRKFVAIAAHHTSNWDFPPLIAMSLYLRIPAYWLGKRSLFRAPLGRLMRCLGGIAIDRESGHNVVDQVVQVFNEREDFVLGLTPEGTRGWTDHWKTGFYRIAQGAGVRIQLVFIDYKRKVCGMGPIFAPTGDLEADMIKIREFYRHVEPKFPSKRGRVSVARDAEPPHE
jgi:1-acyl-sn-glycerol-3-phosphate acyltransferase